ncbi:hypothetical protein E2C01_099636 [Portunus trituberculatus]|uniref:Uncharacterized protein n=1 Tax=Portunus trituberculatus TaxID=210409 RepID=A0A5B7KBA1_PORTR|nr:hypothetical protein [Portunus trituberculatus]
MALNVKEEDHRSSEVKCFSQVCAPWCTSRPPADVNHMAKQSHAKGEVDATDGTVTGFAF